MDADRNTLPWVYSAEELKAQLPIEYVAAELGLHVDEAGRALCPLHDDHRPSLELKAGEPEGDWWVCSPCGTGGDVLRLIRVVEGLTFPTTLVRASEMLSRMPAGWERDVSVAPPAYVPDAEWYRRVAECEQRGRDAGHGLVAYAYGLITGEESEAAKAGWDRHLIDKWGWGIDESARVIIPHWNDARELTAVKVRRRGAGWKCYGELPQLYGDWLSAEHDDVLLCEGESDAVWADAFGGVDVRALPSGARGARNDWVQSLAGWRRVYVCFDGDRSGREALPSWQYSLGDRARVVELGDGLDLRSSGMTVAELLDVARVRRL